MRIGQKYGILIPEIQAAFGKKPKYLFLDEIRLIPNWSKWVRRILDSESINLFITGSSSKMGNRELSTALRGRSWDVKVSPLNFSEYYYKDDKGNEVDFVILEQGKAQALYQVSFDLADEETRSREVRSLLKTGAALHCSNLNIVTFNNDIKSGLPSEIEVITPDKLL